MKVMRPALCYLCGLPLGDDRTGDHVPPKQFFPAAFRRGAGPQLVTVPSHRSCNKAFQADEDYVVTTLAGFAYPRSEAGRLLWRDVNRNFARPEGQTIGHMILHEFEQRPSGLVLPPGKIAKRFDGKRVRRVMWKIARGLYFRENNRVLPEATPASVRLVLPGEEPSAEIKAVLPEPEQGRYPAVFAYRHRRFDVGDGLHVWALWLWDAVACSVACHDPDCPCAKCGPHAGGSEPRVTDRA
jgi:hypothetical protein